MPVDIRKIEQLKLELAEAERELMTEDGQRYRILKRIIPEAEMSRYLETLTTHEEKVLFGLELPEEPKRRGRKPSGDRAAKAGGNLKCPICGKGGLSERGFKLHMARLHKGESAEPVTDGTESGEA